ncbi:outer membrane protein assembly factor BamB family protein [Streptomyces sudanensis]|uniref:outer membrane protein assembly factor BamB family protein n=1 Tax=Streptomyces sudanensis TaxID=436397 RepID=UPI0020CC7202|nr:PQQ-binding-like beta-propeller repeat protein [Streptomyces sudanensis]MCP9959896.1 PQQ-binding-like beta-propeller repeat protein [Streptomyces sudanensis]MCP9999703.1 PQQ-binding-like beta-propeller repeat protein [Streptomyces sudanensis]
MTATAPQPTDPPSGAEPGGLSRRRLLTGGAALTALGAGGTAAWAACVRGGDAEPRDTGTVPAPQPRWTRDFSTPSSLVGVAGGVLVVSGAGEGPQSWWLAGVDVLSGARLWQSRSYSTVTDVGELLAVGVNVEELGHVADGTVRGVDPRTGEMVPLRGDLGRPGDGLDTVHATGQPGVVHLSGPEAVAAYDLASRSRLWIARHSSCRPGAVAGGVLLCTTEGRDAVVGLDRADGTRRWRRTFAPTDLGPIGPRSVGAGTVYLGGREVVALDADGGEELWRWGADRKAGPRPDRQYYQAPQPVGGVVHTVAPDGRKPDGSSTFSLIALDAATGRHLWTHRSARGMFDRMGAPLVRRGTVYVDTGDGTRPIVAVDTRTHATRWVLRGSATSQEWGGGALLDGATLYVSTGTRVVALPMGAGRSRGQGPDVR